MNMPNMPDTEAIAQVGSNIAAEGPEERSTEELLEVDEGQPPRDSTSLTSADVKSDPILSALARQQSSKSSSHTADPPKTTFKARPAPVTTHTEGLGPKMTKSAALRQGLDWEAIKPARSESTTNVGFGSTPGHKRTMSHNIASLAAPKTAPRQNRSSQLRSGEGAVEVVKKDMEAAAAENKAREKAERDARRKSVALPASLSVPSIAPRMNRSSLLRAGSMKIDGDTTMGPPVSWKPKAALLPTSAGNIKPPSEKGGSEAGDKAVSRRASIAGTLKSLAKPSIAPRMNKAALLRAPPSASSTPSVTPAPTIPNAKPASRHSMAPTTSDMAIVSTAAAKPRASLAPYPGPKPTKASLLRAGLGAQILAGKI